MKTFFVSLRDFSTDLEHFPDNFSCGTSSINFKKPMDQFDTIQDITFITSDSFLIDIISTWNIKSFLDIKNSPILVKRKTFSEYCRHDRVPDYRQKFLKDNIGKMVFSDKKVYEIKTNDKWYSIVKKITKGEWLTNKVITNSKFARVGGDDYFGLDEMCADLYGYNMDVDSSLRHDAELNLLKEAIFRKYNNIKELDQKNYCHIFLT